MVKKVNMSFQTIFTYVVLVVVGLLVYKYIRSNEHFKPKPSGPLVKGKCYWANTRYGPLAGGQAEVCAGKSKKVNKCHYIYDLKNCGSCKDDNHRIIIRNLKLKGKRGWKNLWKKNCSNDFEKNRPTLPKEFGSFGAFGRKGPRLCAKGPNRDKNNGRRGWAFCVGPPFTPRYKGMETLNAEDTSVPKISFSSSDFKIIGNEIIFNDSTNPISLGITPGMKISFNSHDKINIEHVSNNTIKVDQTYDLGNI